MKNESGELMKAVNWGDILYLGDIESGESKEDSPKENGKHPIYFMKNETMYISKNRYTVDGSTSATFTHKDSTDAVPLDL